MWAVTIAGTGQVGLRLRTRVSDRHDSALNGDYIRMPSALPEDCHSHLPSDWESTRFAAPKALLRGWLRSCSGGRA